MKRLVLIGMVTLAGCSTPWFGGIPEGHELGTSQEVPAPRGPVYERAYRWLAGPSNYRVVGNVTNQSIRAEHLLGNGSVNVLHATFSGGNLATRITVDAWTDIIGDAGRRRAEVYDDRLPLEVDAFFVQLSCEYARWRDCP